MANYTAQEAQDLWDTRATSIKCYNEGEPQDSANFLTYIFSSQIGGAFPVDINSAEDGVSVTHSSSVGTIETNIKAHIETLEKAVPLPPNEVTI